MRLDTLHQNAGQHVRPCVIRRHSHPGGGQLGGKCSRVSFTARTACGQQVNPGKTRKSIGHAQAFGFCKRITDPVPEPQQRGSGNGRGQPQERGAILHQHGVILPHPVPFQHGKLWAMQRPAFAVAPDMGKAGDPGFPRRQQLFHREFGRSVQIHRMRHAVITDGAGGKAVQMRLISGADLQCRRVHFDKILIGQPAAQCALNPVAGQQKRAAVGVNGTGPPRG